MRTIASEIRQMARFVEASPTHEVKIKNIRYFGQDAQIRKALCFLFDSRIKSWLPSGKPPKPQNRPSSPMGILENEGMFRNMLAKHKIDYFFKLPFPGGDKSGINQAKLQEMFANMVADIHPDDAELLIAIKDKKFPYGDHITPQLMAEAWVDLVVDVPVLAPVVVEVVSVDEVEAPEVTKAKPAIKPLTEYMRRKLRKRAKAGVKAA